MSGIRIHVLLVLLSVSVYGKSECQCGCVVLQASLYEANIPQSKVLAGEGNRAAKAGQFVEAVSKYSEAISLYPFDHRYIHVQLSCMCVYQICVCDNDISFCDWFVCTDTLGIDHSATTTFVNIASMCIYRYCIHVHIILLTVSVPYMYLFAIGHA